MSVLVKGIALAFGLVVVLSLVGAGQVAGLVAAPVLLVSILGFMVSGARPAGRGSGRARARGGSFLYRYRDATPPGGAAHAVIAAFAVWEVLSLVGSTDVSVLSAGLLVPVVAYGLKPDLVGEAYAVAGGGAITARLLLQRDECADTVSLQGFLMYVAVLTVAVLSFASVRSGWSPFGGALRARYTGRRRLILLFGLLEVAAFAVHPSGLEIWSGAPAWAPFVVIGLVGIVAMFAGYAFDLTLSLLAVAVVFGQVVLASVEVDLLDGARSHCGHPGLGLGYAIAFVLLAITVQALRPGARPRVGAR